MPATEPMRVLETTQLVKAFGGLIAVNKVDFHADENEIVGLIGPNGAGKTTLFNAITGVYGPTSGTIRFKGREIAGMLPSKVTKLGVAHLPEHPPLQRDDGPGEHHGGAALPYSQRRAQGRATHTSSHTRREGRARHEPGPAGVRGPGGPRRRAGQESALWVAAEAGDRPGAGHGAG